ncbi:MAG: NADPH:quinone reductase-like Zn-dependent oxidoreductase [Parasphingorhabdus sp.]|jgi:NADPH:quinone reductase-like Zn-dependent oxidoreductase
MTPEMMNAVVTIGHGGLEMLELREVAVPQPTDREVLVRVGACGLNNTDIWVREGAYGSDEDPNAVTGTGRVPHAFPLIQGADIVGEIVETGSGVSASRIGERVICNFMTYREGEGGLEMSGGLGSSRSGGYAQYCAVPNENAYAIESDYSDAELSTFICAYLTAENMLETASVGPDDTVLVTGASGGVGTALIQLSHARGARVAALTSESKFKAVQSLNPAAVVSRDCNDLGESLQLTLGTSKVSVVADVVAGKRFSNFLSVLPSHGRYVTAGAIGGAIVPFDVRTLYLRHLTFFGVSCGMPWHFERVLERLNADQIKPLLHGTYSLSEIHQAQRDFIAKKHFGNLAVLP